MGAQNLDTHPDFLTTGIATLKISFSVLLSRLRPMRLLIEDPEVEGCGYFHKAREEPLHILGNILRILVNLVLAPLWVLTPRAVIEAVSNYMQPHWLLEQTTALDSVLTTALGGGQGQYDPTGFKPSWVLRVTIRNGALEHSEQIPFSTDVEQTGYTALSYPMASAFVLAREAEFTPEPPPPGREYTLRDRRLIARYLLQLYCAAHRPDGNPDRTEYIWLDEFCLSDDNIQDHETIAKQRDLELGRLGDIFRGAAQTAVFCHEEGCDHTGLKCIWGQRLFTIAEILYAQNVLRMTRTRELRPMAQIFPTSGRLFREAMQTNAARGNKWHLYSIFQHTANAGSVPWQLAIHSLVVEAVRRDESGGFRDHKYLGRALNGLLPRRSRLEDLGSTGWNDLTWLLELNQGFYNAASLAAVCSIADNHEIAWLGKPIDPTAGNERLEPLVSAFPVSQIPDPPLSIIGCKTLGFRSPRLKRDAYGLYNNMEMRGLKLLMLFILVSVIIIAIGVVSSDIFDVPTMLLVVYVTTVAYCMMELLVSTIYLDRNGWAFFEDSQWGDQLEMKLAEQDHNLSSLTYWGARQLIPRWEAPGRRPWFKGRLVDLHNRNCVEMIVVDRPDSLIPLAIHGSGVTCMLVTRPTVGNEPTPFAQKVGMCNLPPYILAQTAKCGSIYVKSKAA